MKFNVVAFAISSILLSGGAHAVDDKKPSVDIPPSNVKFDVIRGDAWNFEQRDGITDELKSVFTLVVTDVTDKEIDVRTRSKNTSTGAETTFLQTYDRNWHRKDSGNNVYRPGQEEVGIPNDLTVGKTWKFTYEQARISPVNSFKWVGNGKVVDWEKVTLPDGQSYDAFKIQFHQQVTPVLNNHKYETDFTQWYAPSVNHFVKTYFESLTNGKVSDAGVEFLKDYQPHARE